ncbi:hypothetical protein [Paenibacillus glycanilyticus]|nr:hypothetical protein [Paenibacillus glycanilyticus]
MTPKTQTGQGFRDSSITYDNELMNPGSDLVWGSVRADEADAEEHGV